MDKYLWLYVFVNNDEDYNLYCNLYIIFKSIYLINLQYLYIKKFINII